MTGPFVPVGILNPIRAVMGIHNQRFNLFVKCSSPLPASPDIPDDAGPAAMTDAVEKPERSMLRVP